jgi:hypothetical protein
MADITPYPNSSHRKKSSTWRLLRTKDGDTDDPDWLGDVSTVADIPAADRGVASLYWEVNRSVATYIEFYMVSFNSSNVALDRGTGTYTAQLVEIANPPEGSAAAATDELASGSTALAACNLHDKYRVLANGLDAFTIRIITIANEPATHDHFELYYREVVA